MPNSIIGYCENLAANCYSFPASESEFKCGTDTSWRAAHPLHPLPAAPGSEKPASTQVLRHFYRWGESITCWRYTAQAWRSLFLTQLVRISRNNSEFQDVRTRETAKHSDTQAENIGMHSPVSSRKLNFFCSHLCNQREAILQSFFIHVTLGTPLIFI